MKIIIIVNIQLLTKIERQPESSNMLWRSPKSNSFEFCIALWKGTCMKRIQDTYLQKQTIHLVLDKHLSLKPKWHFHFPHHQVELAASPT